MLGTGIQIFDSVVMNSLPSNKSREDRNNLFRNVQRGVVRRFDNMVMYDGVISKSCDGS